MVITLTENMHSIIEQFCIKTINWFWRKSTSDSFSHYLLNNKTVTFALYRTTVYTSLPSALCDNSLSLNMFGQQLKAYLFRQWQIHLVLFWYFCDSSMTYLLAYLLLIIRFRCLKLKVYRYRPEQALHWTSSAKFTWLIIKWTTGLLSQICQFFSKHQWLVNLTT